MSGKNYKKISVAIPTYNSSKYLNTLLKSLQTYECIDEVVIQDDASNNEEFNAMKNIIKKFDNSLNINLKKNQKNIGAFQNKYLNIQNCKNKNVYQLDSDNAIACNLDLVIQEINDDNFLYIPSKIFQFRKYKNVSKLLSLIQKKYSVTFTKNDFIFSLDKIQKEIQGIEKYTIDKNINWVLNSGNFIVNKNKYIESMNVGFVNKIRPQMDAVAISYFWLKGGGEIKTLKNLKHYHRKRYDSVSFTEKDGSFESQEEYKDKIFLL